MHGTCCGGGYCTKCSGMKWLILGLLILINFYWLNWNWWLFVGVVVIVKGFLMVVKPSCGCNVPAPVETSKTKKRKK